MRQAQTAKILRIHISESERYQGQPLYEVTNLARIFLGANTNQKRDLAVLSTPLT